MPVTHIHSQSPGGRHGQWTGFVILASVSHQEQHTGEEGCHTGRGIPHVTHLLENNGASLDGSCFLSPPGLGTKSPLSEGQGALEEGRKDGFIGQLFRPELPRGLG